MGICRHKPALLGRSIAAKVRNTYAKSANGVVPGIEVIEKLYCIGAYLGCVAGIVRYSVLMRFPVQVAGTHAYSNDTS